ncbi:3-oxoadipate enol-lactonase [Thalassobaculum litoreum]|uniref:3-oxoadipate enol-lactonase n=1 Tax=Thalassobaculum litoreum DSM 18839 TaxID=1123362 RepID=A0A8G2BHU3_9PROT|nr:3-oxoadipate enol-lactonase [Thalassobaculum litoreum]SDF78272.1 3-oxoadipate enol-lactonase [Thalassobaculum litoreum DSM 18839]
MPHAKINGIDLYYEISGREDGPPILFSNSLASTLHMWDPQMPAFRKHYKVIRYDSRGHGKSSAPDGAYSIETLVDDAIGLLDHLGIDKTDFCGLSKGGMVGQRLATLHPDRVERLVLCDTACYMGPPELWEGRIDTAAVDGMDGVVDATIMRWFTGPFQKRDPDAVDKVREMILNTPVAGFVGCCRAIQAMDQRETIQAIAAPTLVVVGADDPGTTPDAAREIQKRIEGARLEILPEAAHLANIEQPKLFDEAVLGFLGKG